MKRRRLWTVLCVVVLVVAGGTFFWLRARNAAKGPGLEGEVVAVERATVRKTVSADGTLKPLTTVEVKSYAGGAVNTLAVDVGDYVRAGQLVAVIDPTDSQTTHTQALADLDVAKAGLAKARAQLRVQDTLNAADIASARAGEATAVQGLAQLKEATHPASRAQTKAALDEAAASLNAGTKDLEKLRDADQPQAKAAAQAAVEVSTAALNSATSDLERLRVADQPQTVADAKATVDRATAALESSRKSLDRLEQAGHPQARVQASSGLAKARSDLDVAGKELQRNKALRDKGYISQSDLDAAQSVYNAREADLANAEELSSTITSDQASQIRTLQMTVAQSEADLTAAQEHWRTLEQQLSAQTRSAEAKLAQARADLGSAQEVLNTIDGQQAAALRSSEAKVEQLQAAVLSAQEGWRTIDRLQETEVRTAESKVSDSRATVSKAQAGVVNTDLRVADVSSGEASVTKAEAAVSNAAIMLGYTTIIAPRDGVVLSRSVEEGTIVTSGRSSVSTGTTLLVLGDISRVFADVQVAEANLADISMGQSVDVRVEAFVDKPAQGVVTRIDPQGLTTSNVTTVLVEVEIQDPTPDLLPGLSASCDFLVKQVDDALSVPRRAVSGIKAGQGTVKVVHGEATEPVTVQVGLQGDDTTEILSGVDAGTNVLVPRLGANAPPSDNRGRDMGRRMGGGGFAAGPSR